MSKMDHFVSLWPTSLSIMVCRIYPLCNCYIHPLLLFYFSSIKNYNNSNTTHKNGKNHKAMSYTHVFLLWCQLRDCLSTNTKFSKQQLMSSGTSSLNLNAAGGLRSLLSITTQSWEICLGGDCPPTLWCHSQSRSTGQLKDQCSLH